MALNTTTWNAVVKKKYVTSSSFKALDAAVKAYLQSKSNLSGLTTAWGAWTKKFTDKGQTYKDSDRYVAGSGLEDIAALVQAQSTGPVNPGSLAAQAVSMGGGGLRHVVPVHRPPPPPAPTGVSVTATGWNYVAYDQANPNHNWAGAPTAVADPLNFSKTARINESFARAKKAVELARDAMLKFPKNPTAWTNTADQGSYIDYFGPYSQTRFLHVLENLRVLVLAFATGPNVVDIRNTTSGGNCYAACVRRNLKVTRDGSMALSGKVDIFLGTAFLDDRATSTAAKYAKGTDATVGTLIHEFAHGSFAAVDAPMVNPAGTAWTLTPSNLVLNHDDYGISPDPWQNQSSTEADDKRLAQFAPDVAVRNADNYGQFAREILMRKAG